MDRAKIPRASGWRLENNTARKSKLFVLFCFVLELNKELTQENMLLSFHWLWGVFVKYFLVRGGRQKTKSFTLLPNYFSHSVDSKSPLLTQIATLLEHALSWINIEELYLDNNKLTDTHIPQLESIRFCTKLKKLSLSLNFIPDKGALQFANVPLK